jgi:MerR family transcriptional regulator, light-induced transcriptional regulator
MSSDELVSIGELADRTGVPSSTLRSWEQRAGFPDPVRTAGGQRRYRAGDADLVRRVQEARDRGLSLPAAVSAVRRVPQPGAESLFAQLRRHHPHLDVLSAGFPVMRSLSFAIEDECLAHASRPVLFGAFQTSSSYERSGRRWQVLARSAAVAVAFADFPATDPAARPARVALEPDSPMLNEWSLVCHDPEVSVALVAWERPRGSGPRRFEALLTLEPDVVAHAARLCAETAERCGLPGTVERLDEHGVARGEDPRRTASLLRRFATYADA